MKFLVCSASDPHQSVRGVDPSSPTSRLGCWAASLASATASEAGGLCSCFCRRLGLKEGTVFLVQAIVTWVIVTFPGKASKRCHVRPCNQKLYLPYAYM